MLDASSGIKRTGETCGSQPAAARARNARERHSARASTLVTSSVPSALCSLWNAIMALRGKSQITSLHGRRTPPSARQHNHRVPAALPWPSLRPNRLARRQPGGYMGAAGRLMDGACCRQGGEL